MNKRDKKSEDWQQYYPTYSYKNEEIVLKEYELSSNNILSQEKVFTNATNFTLLSATIIGSLLGYIFQNENKKTFFVSLEYIIPAFIILFSFSIFLIKYFADRQKSIVFDSRKIVVLRSMLGLSYGSQQLVLPNWRLEGASNPFVIKQFPGWFTSTSYPFWIVTIFSSILMYFLIPLIYQLVPSLLYSPIYHIGISSVWILSLLLLYRKELFDVHESYLLLFIKFVSKVIGLKLVTNFEYIIYRARLSKYEAKRLDINLEEIKRILIQIEDKTFYKHSGWSFKSTLRAFLSISPKIRQFLKIGRKSGGSTITQQLCRTLFIVDYHKTYRRKIIEILLAKWVEKKLPKEELIEIYLSSVRFGVNTFGLSAAIRYYFNASPKNFELDAAQSFFLIERVSNIRNNIMVERLKVLIKELFSEGIITLDHIAEIKELYKNQVQSKVNISLFPESNRVKFEEWYLNWNPK